MAVTTIISYFLAAAIVGLSLYMVSSNIKYIGDDAVQQTYLKLHLGVVALTVLALIVAVIWFRSLSHNHLSLMVLVMAVASFYMSSFLHRKAFKKTGQTAAQDAQSGGQ